MFTGSFVPILQPLDVGAYYHVKPDLRKLLTEYYTATNFNNLTKERFDQLYAKLFSSDDAFLKHK